jgi:pyruvate formate lyase activating enzyme
VTPISGTTFNIQRFSTKDGPGIRTTVFLKGCSLFCPWCHNPEGISRHPELIWYGGRCVGVRDCLSVCPVDALELTPQGMQIDRGTCTACGDCAEVCPAGALEIIGREWTPQELLGEVRRDRIFYETSGGGVTLSGGEPMRQADFVAAFARLCKEEDLHVAIDTCGAADWEEYEQVLPWIDLVLYDLKLSGEERHRTATGADQSRILETARRIAATGLPMWIRTPIIPGFTADEANIAALGDLIARELPTAEKWELLAYTNLGQPKYHRLDQPYALEGIPLLTQDEMEQLFAVAVERVGVAVWSGTTRD